MKCLKCGIENYSKLCWNCGEPDRYVPGCFNSCADEQHLPKTKKENEMEKVRGPKFAEFNFAGAKFAVVRIADPSESEYITPGSDQADALIRIEQIAELLECEAEDIEKTCTELVKIAYAADELVTHMNAEEDFKRAQNFVNRFANGDTIIFVPDLGPEEPVQDKPTHLDRWMERLGADLPNAPDEDDCCDSCEDDSCDVMDEHQQGPA
jgi:hypothetical protein